MDNLHVVNKKWKTFIEENSKCSKCVHKKLCHRTMNHDGITESGNSRWLSITLECGEFETLEDLIKKEKVQT